MIKSSVGRGRKRILIEHLGGKCKRCERKYDDSNLNLFEFHHRDPSTKSFNIGKGILFRSMEELVKEADKCNLLCVMCHDLMHDRPRIRVIKGNRWILRSC